MEISEQDSDIDRLQYERAIWNSGINHITGIDEVGRGPLAGPVYACAVVFQREYFLPEVRDSKELSEKKREYLKEILCDHALSWSLGSADVNEIDQLNIRQATFIAMRRAISRLKIFPGYILFDGENLPDSPYDSRGIIKGDKLSFTIGAASIIAKVSRDDYMKKIDREFPQYNLKKNKGYGTAEHIRAIKQYGPCKYHRMSFLKKIID